MLKSCFNASQFKEIIFIVYGFRTKAIENVVPEFSKWLWFCLKRIITIIQYFYCHAIHIFWLIESHCCVSFDTQEIL